MKCKKKGLMLAIGLFSLFLIVPVFANAARGVSDKEILLGFIGDMTGPTVGAQIPYQTAIKHYFRHVNENGGVHGRQIKMLAEDDQYQASKTVAAFKKVIKRDKALALVITGITGLKALYKQIEKEKVPCIGTVSTSDDMITPFKRYIFPIMSTYEAQVKVIYNWIEKDLKGEKPRIAVVTQHNEPGKSVESAARALAKAKGIDLTVVYLSYGALDATSQVLLLKKANPNYIIVQGNITVPVALLRDMKKLDLKCKTIGVFGCTNEWVYIKAGDAAKDYMGVHSVNSWYDEEAPGIRMMREITLKYKPGTEKDVRNRYFVQGFVTAMVIVEGLRNAGRDLNAEKLVNGLESIKDFDTRGICGLVSYSNKSHKGLQFMKIYKSNNVKTGKLTALTDWVEAK